MPLSCDDLGIPKRLHRDGRDPVAAFQDDEELYFRFHPENHTLPDGKVSFLKTLHTEDQSCNRSAFCEAPEDVLYNIKDPNHFDDWGILKIKKTSVPKVEVEHPDTKAKFSYSVEHTPEECMYPHSELRLLKDGELGKKKPGAPIVRANLKQGLGVHMEVVSKGDAPGEE